MKILSFSAKCSDCFGMGISNPEDGTSDFNMDQGYVPYNIGIGGGDYIEMEIDIETGKIIDWDVAKIMLFIEENKNAQDESEL